VQPHDPVCRNCGRKQNLLAIGLDRIYEDDLESLLSYSRDKAAEDPGDYSRTYNLAGAELLNGHYEAARELYKRVIDVNPDFPDAHLNLGVVHAHLGAADEAVAEFKKYIDLDIHSPRVERVLRAICSIKNIPYEDALYETGVSPSLKGRPVKIQHPAKKGLPTRAVGGTMYGQVEQVAPKPRAWGAIDTFFLLIACCAVLAWFLLPIQTKSAINSAISGFQDRYSFSVTSEAIAAVPGDEEDTGEETGPAIINANPGTSSYLPLDTGNRWEYISYDSRSPLGTGRRENESIVEMRVMGYESEEQEIWRVRNGSAEVYYVEKSNGLYSILNPDHPWSTQLIQVPYPPTDGVTRSDLDQTVTVIGTEMVETSMGLFECVKLKYTLPEPPGMEWYAWYGRGVGLVKYIGGGRDGTYHVREIRSYELH
jgi:hypothetical protein